MKIVYEFEVSDITEAINDFCAKHKVNTKFNVDAKSSGEFLVTIGSVDAPKDATPSVPPVPTPPAPQPNPASAQSIFVSKQPQQNVFGKPLTVADAAKE